jgi:hypothetical protein
MEDKLKDLDKIMDKAVYQKKRFSEESKVTVMNRIRQQEKPSRIEKYTWMMKPILSLTVCLLLLVFSISFIVKPPNGEKTIETADQSTDDRVVASLPLLNTLAHIAHRDNQMIEEVRATKNDHYVHLSVYVTPESGAAHVRTAIENLLHRGTELYLEKGEGTVKTIGAPWDEYTVDISVIEQSLDRKGLWGEAESYLLQGIKPVEQNKITWIDKKTKNN